MGSASRSSFFGFEIAKTGLFISQHNLNVTGHNISNVNTPGYTRQRLVTSAIEPYSTIGRLATYEKGILGGGTQSHVIEQLRSDYLDREFRLQNSNLNTWAKRLESFEFIEEVFSEPNEVGYLSHLQDFHNALNDLVTDSPGKSQRTELQSAAKKLTATVNQYYRQLIDQQAGLNKEVEAKVGEVNRLSTAIGDLNKLIYNFEMTGEHANDLRDQRNVLLDELSSLVEIEVREYQVASHEPKRLSVTIGKGTSRGSLVDHTTVNALELKEVKNRIEYDYDPSQPESDTNIKNEVGDPLDNVLAIVWADDYEQIVLEDRRNNIVPPPAGYPFDPLYEGVPRPEANITTAKVLSDPTDPTSPRVDVAWFDENYNGDPLDPDDPPSSAQMQLMYDLLGEGEIKGILTMRDGDDDENIGIPYLVHQLDTIARSIVKEFNNLHNQGYPDWRSSITPIPVPGYTGTEGAGIDFFADYGLQYADDYSKITAGNFKLDDNMTGPDDVWNIACSDVPVTDDNQEGNNHNTMDKLLNLFDREDVPVVDNFSDYYNSFLLTIGFTTDYARTQHTNKETLALSADTQRMSISAVSIDEEMTNMIKFQHAFAASSRVITAMDEALNTIINGMGVVGR